MALGGGGRGALQPWVEGKRSLSPGCGSSLLPREPVKVWERGEQRGAALTPEHRRKWWENLN